MKVHDLVQGSDEWLQFRSTHFGASEAAAMLGLSSKVKRTELLHMKHVGTAKEFTDWVQEHVLDHGHEVEALQRPLIEEDIGEDLYPVTGSVGNLSASYDGLTIAWDTIFEHKQWNEELAAQVRAGVVPDEHMPQCQQQLLVSGGKRVLFVVSDGTRERRVQAEILPDPEWFQRIKDGWAQFERDLAVYEPVRYEAKPEPNAIMRLPALAIQIRGEVVQSNMPAFRSAAISFIEGIKTDLETDDDFVNAAETIKFCEKAEADLELAKSAALGQTADIDELMRTVDYVREALRSKRLTLNSLVESKKKTIKEDAILRTKKAYSDYIAALDAEVTPVRIVVQPGPDFPGAAKGKRTIATMEDALATELANAKIKADAVAKLIRANLAHYRDQAPDHDFLFSDLATIATKPLDDFLLIVKTRLAEYAKTQEESKNNEAAATAVTQQVIAKASQPAEATSGGLFAVGYASTRSAPAPTGKPELRLGVIGERLGFAVTAEFLTSLGFEGKRERNAMLYHESDFDPMCGALINHISRVRQQQKAA